MHETKICLLYWLLPSCIINKFENVLSFANNRLFEKLLYRRLIKFIDKNDILYDLQYGFRNKHSTEHAILDIVNTTHSNMDNRKYSCGIFMNLKKAFDTVNHEILLTKLEH